MKRQMRRLLSAVAGLALPLAILPSPVLADPIFPGTTWDTRTPAQLGVDETKLAAFATQCGGTGVVVKDGYLIYSWGDGSKGDWWSASKPVFSTMLFDAVSKELVTGVDEPISRFWKDGNGNSLLKPEDETLTFRHMADMTSGYGSADIPGAKWAYNDFGIALYRETLEKAYQVAELDTAFDTLFAPLQFQDDAGLGIGYGRYESSPRDFARIGWLWMNKGNWNGTQVVPKSYFDTYLKADLPLTLQQSADPGASVDDYLGVGSYGGGYNQTPYGPGVYGFNWWFNKVKDSPGPLHWPDAPADTFQANGRWGREVMTIMPSIGLVVAARGTGGASWGAFGAIGDETSAMNRTMKLLVSAMPRPALLGAVSRKTHGTAGDFDIPLPLVEEYGIETRAGTPSGAHTLIFNFDHPVHAGTATVYAGTATVSTISFSGTTMTVGLTGVADAQKLVLTLSGVLADGLAPYSGRFSFRLLAGDSDASKEVTAADVSLIQASLGLPVTADLFRLDVDADGDIDAADQALAQAAIGKNALPFVPPTAGLMAYEGFNYPADSLIGGAGEENIYWLDKWEGTPLASYMRPGSLPYRDGTGKILVTSGNRLQVTAINGSSEPARRMTIHHGAAGTSRWISFLGQRTGDKSGNPATYRRGAGITLYDDAAGTVARVDIGENSNVANDVWTVNSTGGGRSLTTVPIDKLSLIVVRIDFKDGKDDLRMWVDPPLGTAPSDASAAVTRLAVDELSFDRIRPFTSATSGVDPYARFLLDEFRVADNFADATPYRQAKTYFDVDFADYEIGNLVGQDGWLETGSGGLYPIQVFQGAAHPDRTGQDTYRPFDMSAPTTAGTTIYSTLAFTVRTAQADATTGAGHYFFHLTNPLGTTGTGNFLSGLWVKKTTAGRYLLGIAARGDSGTTPTYGTTELYENQPYSVIIAWDCISGSSNDRFSVYVNPAGAIREDVTPYVSVIGTTLSEPAQVVAANFRQGLAASSPTVAVSSIIVGDAWLPGPVPPTLENDERRWATKTPAEVGMDAAKLGLLAERIGGAGSVVKDGYLIYTWGDPRDSNHDWFSAAKPVFSTLLFNAIDLGYISSVDESIDRFWRDANGNPLLSEKDRAITFRMLADMTSTYGTAEVPGTAFGYNDYAIALYRESLAKAYGLQYLPAVFGEYLAGPLGMLDGSRMRSNARVIASTNDFARIGWMWLNKGWWRGAEVVPQNYFETYMKADVPATLPVSADDGGADDYLGIGSYGAGTNQSSSGPGIYGFNWWFNRNRDIPGLLTWPGAPVDTFQANGRWGAEAMVVIPSCGLVVAAYGGNGWGGFNVPGDATAGMNQSLAMLVDALPKMQLEAAVSRKTHAAAGPLDLAMPVTGAAGIESRTGGAAGDFTLRFSFDRAVTDGLVSVASGAGQLSGPPSVADNVMTVNLTGVTNVQKLGLKFDQITGAGGAVYNGTFGLRVAAGDVNASGGVSSADHLLVRRALGLPVTSTEVRFDVNCDGVVTSADAALVQQALGKTVDP